MLQAIANSNILKTAIFAEHCWLAAFTIFHKTNSWINRDSF